MLPYVYAFAFVVLTAPGIIVAVRALPWVERQMFAGVKPWICDICMSFWMVALLCTAIAGAFGWRFAFVAGPSYSVTLWLLDHLQRTQPPAMAATPAPELGPTEPVAPPDLASPGLAETLEPPKSYA